jgi:hypothetical protein
MSTAPAVPRLAPHTPAAGTPAEPASLELVAATLVNGDGLVPTAEQVDNWADEWLQHTGYDRAVDVACEQEEA